MSVMLKRPKNTEKTVASL